MSKIDLKESLYNQYKQYNISEETLNTLFKRLSDNYKNDKIIKEKYYIAANELINLRERLKTKYNFIKIDDEVFNNAFNIVLQKEYDKLNLSREFEKIIDKYVLKLYKENKIDIRNLDEKYKVVKTIILKNQKYYLENIKLQETYEKAIKLLKKRYNYDETMSFNILDNMKYIISNNLLDRNIDTLDFMQYDISFMSEYMQLYSKSIEEIARTIDCDYNLLKKCMYGQALASSDIVEYLCIIYNQDDYDMLKEYINSQINKKKNETKIKKSDNNINKYRITFIKKYLLNNSIDLKDVSKYLNISEYTFEKLLDGTYYISEEKLNILCKYFNVNNYNELKEMANQENNNKPNKNECIKINDEVDNQKMENYTEHSIKNYNELKEALKQVTHKEKLIKDVKINVNDESKINKETQTDEKRDMSFMKEYVELYNYNLKKLSELWHCGIKIIPKILNGEIKLKQNLLWETYTEFSVKNYDELKEKIKQRVENKKMLLNKNTNVIKNIEVKSKEEKKEVVIHKEKKDEIKYVYLYSIDKDELFELLDVKNMNYRECMITILLFSGITNKSIDNIANFLSMSKEYIKRIYLNDLKLIEEKLKSQDKNIKLVYKKDK